MTQFAFTVTNEEGQKFTGTLMASDLQAAMKTLAERDLVVTHIHPVSSHTAVERLMDLLGMKRRPVLYGESLITFTQQIAAMLDAGVTVKSALDTMCREASDPDMRQLLLEMSNKLGAGTLLSDVMAAHPEVFSRQFRATVGAGENGGTLPQALATMATLLEREEHLRRKVQSALYYPAFVITTAVVILVLLLVMVVPRYATFYAALGGQLPAPTRILMGIGTVLRTGMPYIVVGLVLLNIGCVHLMRTPRGRLAIDRARLRIPVLGKLFQMLCIARFMRTVSSLLRGGIQIVEAMRYGAETMNNAYMEHAVEKVRGGVLEGEAVVDCLRASGVFTEMALTMVAVGEQSGSMDRLLEKVASYYEERVEVALRSLAELVEPVVILGVGLVVGAMVFALVMPVFQLMTLFMK